MPLSRYSPLFVGFADEAARAYPLRLQAVAMRRMSPRDSVIVVSSDAPLGTQDSALHGPTVTPVPAPPDDQLVRLAVVGSVAGTIATMLLFRWLRRHVVVSWRR